MKARYERLVEGLPPDAGRLCIEVPPMRGIDEDMRNWSFYMILEHNAIVDRTITAIVSQLARDEELHGDALINPKADVMPSSSADETQLKVFLESIDQHVETVRRLGRLRGTEALKHPVFGAFDAHKWNCMFAFHLRLHYPQADYVVRRARAEHADGGNAPPRAPHP